MKGLFLTKNKLGKCLDGAIYTGSIKFQQDYRWVKVQALDVY